MAARPPGGAAKRGAVGLPALRRERLRVEADVLQMRRAALDWWRAGVGRRGGGGSWNMLSWVQGAWNITSNR